MDGIEIRIVILRHQTILYYSFVRFHNGGIEEFKSQHERIKRGDIIGVEGHPTRSDRGELSITPTNVTLLTPCLHMLPVSFDHMKMY